MKLLKIKSGVLTSKPLATASNITIRNSPKNLQKVISGYQIPDEWQTTIYELLKQERDIILKRIELFKEYESIANEQVLTQYKKEYPEE